MSARRGTAPRGTAQRWNCRGAHWTLAVATLVCTASALAQSGGGFDIVRRSADGGGGRSIGAGFAVAGSVGQPDAGRLLGGSFELQGGFHRRATGTAPADVLFRSGFE